ncbi:MAG: ABC-ATPase domain-containing protein [Lachnospiraceae bacterium]|nr:ABC-ATPase domain-containing protein [Lachnospiraceae bacterium]
MKSDKDLKKLLSDIDRKGYPAYKQTKGAYRFKGYILSIDHVQGDPFASPSKVSIRIDGSYAGFPSDHYDRPHRRIALQDLLMRRFAAASGRAGRGDSGSGKSGLIISSRPGQEILERTGCRIETGNGDVIFRMEMGFPAFGRSINAKGLIDMLYERLPELVEKALIYNDKEKKTFLDTVFLADDQLEIRKQMKETKLCAFIADGAILPRKSGASDLPMTGAVPFRSPESLRIRMELPHAGTVTGMGIKTGITLIVGGGYHGKSTLLHAMERGVYDHIRGDGREFVLTDETAVKIRSEDGRCVHKEDISLFIGNLPDGRDAKSFMSEDASGSTSQAANVMEAVECGTGTLLIDEDTCATNFMVRDELMQKVIHKDKEPITPFIERMKYLRDGLGISCVLVAGSSGAFFGTADTVIQMDRYEPCDITDKAREEFRNSGLVIGEASSAKEPVFDRIMLPVRSFRQNERLKVRVHGRDGFSIDREEVDIRYLEQIVDQEQTSALAQIVRICAADIADGKLNVREILDRVDKLLETEGTEALCGRCTCCGFARPRRQEIAATLNRCRFLRFD